jgi:hypothetical protein
MFLLLLQASSEVEVRNADLELSKSFVNEDVSWAFECFSVCIPNIRGRCVAQ